jgi:ATP-dependent DNA helicase DinG
LQSIKEILGSNGPLAKHVHGFAPRDAQQSMAEAIARTLEEGKTLVAEAGTGTGKTFAYLVPALLSGQKVIVSTGTKNLQDQLFHKDLPVVRDALEVPVSIALLKGRANYLCNHRLELALDEARFTRPEAEKVARIYQWSKLTRSGDIAQCDKLSENDPVWINVTSTSDNCLGQECSHYDSCHVIEARRQAQAADIVVVNHHLLLADMMLREEGFADLLPSANAFIIDEAHQLPEIASEFFGYAISGNQLLELARDAEAEYIKDINEGRNFIHACDSLQKTVRDLRLNFGNPLQRASWSEIADNKKINVAIEDVAEELHSFENALKPLAERSKGLDKCYQRCQLLSQRFDLLTHQAPENYIHWFETHKRSFSFKMTPLEIGEVFQEKLASFPAAWVFTSATLTVNNSFDHYVSRLGLQAVTTRSWESPFNFQQQALLYLPTSMPQPNSPGFTDAVLERAIPVINKNPGGSFLLFTSHRALQEAAARLEEKLDRKILVQGEAPRDKLLDEFRATGNAVLLGTSSFWEGVDVRGRALSCVIIDKLPFASPGDPVLQARIEVMRKQGQNPFMHYQLPSAVITLKQGVGRLIRDVDDYGVLMIADPRITEKAYGKTFIKSLPAMPVTRHMDEVFDFYERLVNTHLQDLTA